MANETATKSKRFYCVSLLPDICKTPIGPSTPPIPYSVVGEFSQATNVSPNVKAHSELVILHKRSVIPTVKGDEPGKAGGIKSGTFAKKVETKTASKTYFANGTATVQEGCEVWMNDRNTVGKIYERGGAAPRSRLEQIAAMAQEGLDEATNEVKSALQPVAKGYKDKLSDTLHAAAADAIDKGGKVAAGGVALTGAGAVATATGVGAPVGVPVAAAGAATTAAGGAVTTLGAVAETGATLLDNLADYILTNKTPDLKAIAMGVGQRLLTSVAGSKIPGVNSVLQKGKQGTKPVAPRPAQPRPPDKAKGGKTKKKKDKKSDKPSDCCPKNKAPGGKLVSSRHPVHFGTGEEVLYQTDFVIDGPIPLPWTRCYRSGSELEDWGMCGARWGTPYTASIVTTGKGIIYVDDSGRPMLLPSIGIGAAHDNRKEGFSLTRSSDTEYLLEWRDGSTDKFVRCPSADSLLPHGYDGVNAMHPAGDPVIAERYTISRSQGRDGRGITIERFPDAEFGQVLLRVTSDGGPVLEAMRYEPQSRANKRIKAICIGRVDEVRKDGARVCQVRYEYDIEPTNEQSQADDRSSQPSRYNLVAQTNLADHTRRYGYCHHLLTSYTTYSGFEHTLQWISLAALRARWGGDLTLTDAEFIHHYPITLENSYQARAIATDTADGEDSVRIAYLDEDTTRVTDANGGVLEYKFDANWLAVDVRRIGTNGAANSLGRRVWDKDGMLLAEIDAAGRATRFAYDAVGNLTASTDALGGVTRIDYDGNNLPSAVTDALGHVTRFEYNESGNITSQTDALGHVTTYQYDDKGRLVALTDAKGGTKHVSYNDAGQVASHTDCSGHRTSYKYDQSGRLAVAIDALDHRTQYFYDTAENLTTTVHPDGATEYFEHDTEGNVALSRNAAGQETRYRHNGHGLLIERIDGFRNSVKYRYDALLQLVELINANGESYYLTYDVEGRISSEIGFDGKTTSYIYDQSGQLIATESAGRRTGLLRDSLGQLTAKHTDDGVSRYAYDSLGRLTTAIAPHARSDFAYNALGQLTEEINTYFLASAHVGNSPRNPDARFRTTHTYDELGNRTQTILPNGRRIDILRYGSGHWHGMVWDGRSVVDVERDVLHREKVRHFGASARMTVSREYDSQSRISRMTLRREADHAKYPLRERNFKYDTVGNLLEIAHGCHSQSDTLGSFTYKYDAIGQLVAARQPGLQEQFIFDAANNLIRSIATNSIADSHGADERRLSIISQTTDASGCSYDRNGNLVSRYFEPARDLSAKNNLDLKFDCENRLVQAISSRVERLKHSHYFYDAFGRRIAKQTRDDISSYQLRNSKTAESCEPKTTIFVWDGDLLRMEIGATGSFAYLYEPESYVPLAKILCSNTNQPFVFERHDCGTGDPSSLDNVSHYNCDHIGTPTELLDEHGILIWERHQSAWGLELDIAPDTSIGTKLDIGGQPIRFQGQYKDEETGLHYNRHRYFDPVNVRYITQDPIGLLGGLNNYGAPPNPTGWTDPLGLARGKGGCDPCCGKNPAAEAMATQGKGDYMGVDAYENKVLRQGTILYSLYPGDAPGFAVTNHTLRKAKGDPLKYAQLTQVVPGIDRKTGLPRSMRTRVQVYRVTTDICVGRGVARAQNPTTHGTGGAIQYFISATDVSKLSTKGTLRPI